MPAPQPDMIIDEKKDDAKAEEARQDVKEGADAPPTYEREHSSTALTRTQSSEDLEYVPVPPDHAAADAEDGATLPPHYSTAAGASSPRPESLHSLSPSEEKAVQKEMSLPSVLFAIPFPPPVGKARTTKLPFLLYTLPRSLYKKPVDGSEDQVADGGDDQGGASPGEAAQDSADAAVAEPSKPVKGKGKEKVKKAKKPREKLIKRVERMWGEEVQQGQMIHRGEVRDASKWQTFKGNMARAAGKAIEWMPNSVIQALGRLPPVKKLGQIRVVYPCTPYPELANGQTFTNEEVNEKMAVMLSHAEKVAVRSRWISGALIPVTVAIDAINPAPLFLAEINAAYFAMIYNGAKKSKAVTSADPNDTFTYEGVPSASAPSSPSAPTADFFDPVLSLIYDRCSVLAPNLFPVPPSHKPYPKTDRTLSAGVVGAFKARLPEELWDRHVLDEARIAEDLANAVQKGAKEYVKSLK